MKKIVVDANIIIAAILGSRGTITILTSYNYKFFAPRWIEQEIKKYRNEICEYAKYTQDEFDEYYTAVFEFIYLIEFFEYELFMEEPKKTLGKRDTKDTDYLACALAIQADFIWTNDKDFTSQELIKTLTTQEFIDQEK